MAMVNKLHDVQAAIKTALELITTDADAYNFDYEAVGFGLPDVSEIVSGATAIFISDITEEVISTSGNVDIMRATYTIVSIKQTDPQWGDLGIDAMKVAADTQKALTTDQTLGGVVYMTMKESTAIVYYHSGSTAFVTQVFYSDYPVTIGTP